MWPVWLDLFWKRMAKGGHPVDLIDTNREHVDALNSLGAPVLIRQSNARPSSPTAKTARFAPSRKQRAQGHQQGIVVTRDHEACHHPIAAAKPVAPFSGMPIPPRPVLQRDTTSWMLFLTTRRGLRFRRGPLAGYGCGQAATAKLDEITQGSDTFEATFPSNPLIAAETRILTIGLRAG